jgi:DNA invertase Pin-like site-specific DNA recombinase
MKTYAHRTLANSHRGGSKPERSAFAFSALSGNQDLDTSTAIGRLMLAIIGAVGQAEREAMLERQREGIAKAKRDGRYKGRTPTARRQAADIIRLKSAGARSAEIARKLGIGRASVYRVLGEREKVAA